MPVAKKNEAQKMKTKMRASGKWKRKRNFLKKIRKVDFITSMPLRKGWNLHHLDLREEHYEQIDDDERFECLNKMTHELIHNLYRYWIKDPAVIDRIILVLEKMKKYSND